MYSARLSSPRNNEIDNGISGIRTLRAKEEWGGRSAAASGSGRGKRRGPEGQLMPISHVRIIDNA
jgi:hypothetical protein